MKVSKYGFVSFNNLRFSIDNNKKSAFLVEVYKSLIVFGVCSLSFTGSCIIDYNVSANVYFDQYMDFK